MTLAECSDENIVVPIIVIIADGNSKAEHGDSETSFSSHVGKCAVVIIVIKLRSSLRSWMSGPILAIHQQDVRPAVIVVINKCAAGPHGFRKIFLSESAIVVNEMDP